MHPKGSPERPLNLLRLLWKTKRPLAAEHTWAIIVFVTGLLGVWLMQKVKKGLVFVNSYHINEVNTNLIKVMKI